MSIDGPMRAVEPIPSQPIRGRVPLLRKCNNDKAEMFVLAGLEPCQVM